MILKLKSMHDNNSQKVAGYVSFWSHLFYYITWVYLIPQPYDSLWLRLSCCLISLPLILIDYWPEKLKPWLPAYWQFFLMYVLTITCTYLTLKNNFSTMWMMTMVMAVFTLAILIDEIYILFSNLSLGIFIASCVFFIQQPFPSQLDIASFALIPVILSCSVMFSLIKKKAIAAQEKAKTLKSLAGTIAHEMRNPLSQIHGVIHLIQNNKISNSNEYYEDVIDVINNSHQIIDITMDAINEKPIQKDNFKIISALDICHESVSSYAYKYADHKQKVSVTGIDFQILADPVLVKYILYNLIGNALYYIQSNPKANILITLKEEQRKIEVRDTGPGIAPKNLSKLFDSFYTSGKSGGTGLGLSYCKRTMQALDGDIHCISELDKFTCFILTFPAQTANLEIVRDVTKKI